MTPGGCAETGKDGRLIVNGAQHRTAGSVALALGWPVERTVAAMRDILDAGYLLPARIALPAALTNAA